MVLGLSLLLGYLGSPLGAGLSLDEESYFRWAQRILAGDLIGAGPFFQDPLYPYVLAGVLRVSNGSLAVARLFNLALGVGSVVLLERIVRRLFSAPLAIAAVVLWLMLGSVALDELTISKEPLMTLLLLGAIAVAIEVIAARAAWVAGLLGGALVLARGNFLMLVPFAAAAALWLWPRKLALAAIAGLLALPTLFAVRNGIHEGRWLPSTAATGMVFRIGHHEGADGTWLQAPFARGNPIDEMPDYVREASRREGVEVDAKRASRLFLAEGFRFIAEHPGQELGLLWKKVRLSLSWEEVPGNYSRSCVRDRFLSGLWLTPLGGALLWPFALAAVVAHRRRRAVQLLAAGALLYAGTLWVTFIVERYRLPLWIAAAILAPAGAIALRDWLASAARGRVLVAAIPVAALLVWPVRASSTDREISHCLSLAGATLLQAGRVDEAGPLLAEAAALNPRDGDAVFNLALVAQGQQRWVDAAKGFRRASELTPDNAVAWWGLGTASVAAGEVPIGVFERFFATASAEQAREACGEVAANPALSFLEEACVKLRATNVLH